MAIEKSKDFLSEVLSKDQERLLKQKLKTLGIDEKCIKGGDTDNIEFIPTGVFEVDSILGVGMGIPTGTLVEFCGESQSGKTWLGYKLIGEAQKQGKKCVFFNVENSYYPQRAISCGVNVKELILVENVGSAEKYGELLKFLTESGDYLVSEINECPPTQCEVGIVAENGDYLLTEFGEYLIEEETIC